MSANLPVPSDSPSIYAALSTLTSADGGQLALVRPDNPPPGIAGFLFTIPTEDTVNLESDITDHYTESNRAISDHIALRPETISLRGLVAELWSFSKTVSVPAPTLELPRLGDNGTAPDLSLTTLADRALKKAAAEAAAEAAKRAPSLYSYYESKMPQQPKTTFQRQVFNYFYQLWLGRVVFTVETPFGFFTSMALQSVTMTQDEDTKTVSEVALRFKRIRTVQSAEIKRGQLSGRLEHQASDKANAGTLSKTELTSPQRDRLIAGMIPPNT